VNNVIVNVKFFVTDQLIDTTDKAIPMHRPISKRAMQKPMTTCVVCRMDAPTATEMRAKPAQKLRHVRLSVKTFDQAARPSTRLSRIVHMATTCNAKFRKFQSPPHSIQFLCLCDKVCHCYNWSWLTVVEQCTSYNYHRIIVTFIKWKLWHGPYSVNMMDQASCLPTLLTKIIHTARTCH